MIRTLPALAPALALVAGLATPALAEGDFDFGAMSADDRGAFGEAVRTYLLENPEVIMEAVAVLERQQAAEQVAHDAALVTVNGTELFNDGYSYVDGNPDGDVTLVEFVDYQCGYCKKAYPELMELITSDGNIKMIYKEFPILGDASLIAARFAVSAQLIGGDEAYGPLHHAMMTMRAKVSPEALAALADGIGLDGEAILAGMSDPQVDEIIGRNHALAGRLQITGTPTFVLEDQLLRGYMPLDGMQQIVAEQREKKG